MLDLSNDLWVQLFYMLKLNQRGIAPLVIILIIAVTIITGYGVYRSSNQFNIREDKTSEKIGGRLQNKAPEKEVVNLANSGKLADKPVEIKADETASDSAKFSITPPAGWQKLPPVSQIVVEFLSPTKDTLEEGMVFIDIQPNITVFAAKGDFKGIEEANNAFGSKDSQKTVSKQKVVINGQEGLVTYSTKDLSDLLRDTLESQIKQEIAKSGTKISEDTLKTDIDKLLQRATAKMVSYSFYKDGYYINVTGKALESFWDKRGPQLKKSMDTFKFE